MSLSNLANASYEKKQQRIMILRRDFNEGRFITVESASKGTGYAYSTVVKWAKEGDIPLVQNDGTPVVELTEKNSPRWLD